MWKVRGGRERERGRKKRRKKKEVGDIGVDEREYDGERDMGRGFEEREWEK